MNSVFEIDSHGGGHRLGIDYRIGNHPRMTLETLFDLGMSEAAIARYLDVSPADLARLLSTHNFPAKRQSRIASPSRDGAACSDKREMHMAFWRAFMP